MNFVEGLRVVIDRLSRYQAPYHKFKCSFRVYQKEEVRLPIFHSTIASAIDNVSRRERVSMYKKL